MFAHLLLIAAVTLPPDVDFEIKCEREARRQLPEPETYLLLRRSILTRRPELSSAGRRTWVFAFDGATKSGAVGHYVAFCSQNDDGSVMLTVS